MFSLKIHGPSAASAVVVWELTIQCQIADAAYRRLEEYARVQLTRDYFSAAPHPKTVVDFFSDCAVFLSAAGVISKIVFPRGRRPTKTAVVRSRKLKDFLGVSDLPILRDLGLRNAFEHIDERLDEEIEKNPDGVFVQYHIARTAPPAGLILKRFDPKTKTLSYLGTALALDSCFSEIKQVEAGLKTAEERVWREGGLR